MNMFDEARSIRGMIEMLGSTQNEMAKKLGVSQSYVANKLRLLKLSPECERAIIEKGLSERHARVILRLRDDGERLRAIIDISERGLTVSESEALVDLIKTENLPKTIERSMRNDAASSFLESLSLSVKALVSLGISAKKTVSYYGNKAYVTVCIEE